MQSSQILDLADCTEFRLAVEARPPRFVHGTVILVISLLVAAVAWSALTRADLVVRAPGRVRPISAPQKVIATFRGEVLTGGAGACVREVSFREGGTVVQGETLLRLDTERLDNEIERMKRRITASEQELRKNVRMAGLLQDQFKSARAKLEAEVAQAEEEVRLAKERRNSGLRLAKAEVEHAVTEESRTRKLVSQRVAVRADLDTAILKTTDVREKLSQAKLPIDDGKVIVLRRALAALEKDYRLKLAELSLKQDAKRSEVDADQSALANLELERRQAVIHAPISGVVTTGDIKPGDTLEPGKAILEIAEQSGFRFEVAVPAGEMEDIQVGMPVRMRLDAYDYQKYGTLEGTVRYIAPDSAVNNDKGAVFYLVKVELTASELRRGDQRGPLKLGLTGQAEIVTGRESLLSLLVRKIRRSISLG
jgi:multidrug resistance efflux pump